MKYLIIIVLTVYAVFTILRLFGVFEFNAGTSRLKEEIERDKTLATQRSRERKKLKFYASLTNYLKSVVMNEYAYEQHRYIVERLEIRSKALDRTLTPEEFKGKFLTILGIGVFSIPLCLISKIFLIIPIVCVVLYVAYKPFYLQKVRDEDDIIDLYFIDLYLLMYSRLKKGSSGRVLPVIESYIDTLNQSPDSDMKSAMLKFSVFFASNLNMYTDHVAIPKLKERYRSATISNFCNTATQALQGVDNGDTLLSFKMDLVQKELNAMEIRANKLFEKGQRSIYLIYVILFIFIIAGWMSKIPAGMF